MKASTQRYCITPKNPFYLIGYGPAYESRINPARGVHDDIFAQPILMEIDGVMIYSFQADLIEFEEGFCYEAKLLLHKKYGIDPNLVLFSATHNHSAVMDHHRHWSTGVFSQDYYDSLLDLILSSYQVLYDSLESVTAYYGKGEVSGFYGSRIHLGEKADNEVIMVEFRNWQNEVVAAFCNWATHSTVISPENDLLTADFAGWVGQQIKTRKGYYPSMIVGAAGDSSNRAFRQGTDFAELERVANGCADIISRIEVNTLLDIRFERQQYLVHRVHYTPAINVDEITGKIKAYEIELEQAEGFDAKKVYRDRIRALNRKLVLKEVDVSLYATLIKLNDLEIVTIPGELGSRYGLDIKTLSPAKCCLIFGYTNGHYGYLLQPEVYGLSFETLGSRYRSSDVEAYVGMIKKNL